MAVLSTINGLDPVLELATIILVAAILVIVAFSSFYQLRAWRRSRHRYRTRVIYYC